MNIVYIGIDILYAAMPALLEAGCRIMEVYTCDTDNKTEFNTQVVHMARKLSVPCYTRRITAQDLCRLEQEGCQAVFCAGCYYKIPVSATLPMVNVHPSYLPVGRGAWPMPVMILNGKKTGGVTIHKLASELDTGDILIQREFPLAVRETLTGYMEKASRAIREMIAALMQDFGGYWRNAIPQGSGEYWPCPGEPDWTASEDMDFEQIDRIFRAFYGYECIWREADGERYELIGAEISRDRPKSDCFFTNKDGYYITAEKIEDQGFEYSERSMP